MRQNRCAVALDSAGLDKRPSDMEVYGIGRLRPRRESIQWRTTDSVDVVAEISCGTRCNYESDQIEFIFVRQLSDAEHHMRGTPITAGSQLCVVEMNVVLP